MKLNKYAPTKKVQEESAYFGKAAEFLVVARLLMKQYNAAIAPLDHGVDVLAEKDGAILRFQVKARTMKMKGKGKVAFRAMIAISEKSLMRKQSLPDYYVIVLRFFKDSRPEVIGLISRGQLKSMLRKRVFSKQGAEFRSTWILRDGQHYIKKISPKYSANNFIAAWEKL